MSITQRRLNTCVNQAQDKPFDEPKASWLRASESPQAHQTYSFSFKGFTKDRLEGPQKKPDWNKRAMVSCNFSGLGRRGPGAAERVSENTIYKACARRVHRAHKCRLLAVLLSDGRATVWPRTGKSRGCLAPSSLTKVD